MKSKSIIIKFFIAIFIAFTMLFSHSITLWADDDFTVFRDIDRQTFNEYRYLMVQEIMALRQYFELNWEISQTNAQSLIRYAETGYNYLKDDLVNKWYFNELDTALKRWIQDPDSRANYNDIIETLDNYIFDVKIEQLVWSIRANPQAWNAPLITTFRSDIKDPSGTTIPNWNYSWWIDEGWTRRVIWTWPSINYTFPEEWNFTVFLDVRSNHRNSKWYTDVLPYSDKIVVEVREKIASVILKVNGVNIWNNEEIKFTPDDAGWWLIVDATSSTPTSGTKFKRTVWDFWNGIKKDYDGSPKMERVVYWKEWNYDMTLELTTNENKTVKKALRINIHDPIATINSNKDDWFIGDTFNFSTRSSIADKNLTFTWRIIDILWDKEIYTTNSKSFKYEFQNKWRYNVQLNVKDVTWRNDVDTKIIYINSRPPIADFTFTIPDRSKPNRVLLNGSKSYDLDVSDKWKLRYAWIIEWERVVIDNIDEVWAIWYYTFTSIWEKDVVLEVTDTDNLKWTVTKKVKIDSILSVDFTALPRIITRWDKINFSAISPEARYFEWDFGDKFWDVTTSPLASNTFEVAWKYNVKLRVTDDKEKTNEITKSIFVAPSDKPYAFIDIWFWATQEPEFDESACDTWAYVVDRTQSVNLRWDESINTRWESRWLSYTWKIWVNKFFREKNTTYKFDELGCFPIKLTVKDDTTGATHATDTNIIVKNLLPTLSVIDLAIEDETKDPMIVKATAMGASDLDGVIQSYLWYFYTDGDRDPQWFRITSINQTTFVIPKISGTYYFVVVMEDNNWSKFSSEDLDSSSFSIRMTWDNADTPLIDLKVDKSNILIWENITFRASVKNILGQDITSSAEFAWDFDGDGFYDEQTKEPTITYSYEKSGTFYAKLRVKHKWLTNTRNVQIIVANELKPEFSFKSIWDTIVIFNKSEWRYDKITWDMWDGNKVRDKESFVYVYEDWKSAHTVELRISEWTKIKNIKKDIQKDMRELLALKQSEWIYFFANRDIEDGVITLRTEDEVFVFLWEQEWVEHYGIDYNIDVDSDLNGVKDDDTDNITEPSYNNSGIQKISLDDSKIQTFRIFTIDVDGDIIWSKDIQIVKEYVKDQIDINSINFWDVSDSEKERIERLKTLIQDMDEWNRLKSMEFLQRLQSEWWDSGEKTRIILEFEWYIDSVGDKDSDEMISILESFLLEWDEDWEIRNMAYNVVKNLLPTTLSGYDEIISRLDMIKQDPNDTENNRVLGMEILESIADTTQISNEDKLTIKTQLQVLIYWDISNIPDDIKDEVKKENSKLWWWVLSGIMMIFKIILWLIILILLWVVGLFIWYKLTNKNSNIWFQDFIIEMTSDTKKQKTPPTDIFDTVDDIDPFASVDDMSSTPPATTEVDRTKSLSDEESIDDLEIKQENLPDWLKWSSSQSTDELSGDSAWLDFAFTWDTSTSGPSLSSPAIDTSDDELPDWLTPSTDDPFDAWVSEWDEIVKSDTIPTVSDDIFEFWDIDTPTESSSVADDAENLDIIVTETPIDDESPNWLGGSEEQALTPEQIPISWEAELEENIRKNEKLNKKIASSNNPLIKEIPDWLKWIIDEDKI